MSTNSYYEAYKMIRNITGVGEGKGPMIVYHDGFDTLERWAGFLTGADRIAIGMFASSSRSGAT